MKRTLKTVFSLLLVMAMVLSFSATAQAAGATVTFTGKDGYAIASGSGYTDTDLFQGFKNVMPGDTLTQDITIRNAANGCDYIKVYLKALPHDEDENPLTYSETYENTDGNDQQNVAGERDETVASMQEFLQQLNMTVKNGETVIFQGTPDVAGSLANNVLLGQLSKGESMKLTVELDVPIDLGNEYAHRVGEVDWVFLAEAYQYRQLTVQKVWDDNGDPSRPASVTVNLMRNGVKVDSVELTEKMQWTHTWDLLDDLNEDYKGYTWTVEEEELDGYEVSYKAEGNTFFITNSNDYEPEPEIPPIDLTVKKVWSDMNNKQGNRPGSIVVTLYNGTEAVDKVILSGANNWTYTWTNLDGTGSWSVQESVPLGYKPYYVKSNGVVTITNMVTLIQTGQLNWPIPVLGSLGALLVLFGVYMMLRKRKNKNA